MWLLQPTRSIEIDGNPLGLRTPDYGELKHLDNNDFQKCDQQNWPSENAQNPSVHAAGMVA